MVFLYGQKFEGFHVIDNHNTCLSVPVQQLLLPLGPGEKQQTAAVSSVAADGGF